MMKRTLMLRLSLTIYLCLCGHLYAWGNKETHPALTEKGLDHTETQSIVDEYLKTELGLVYG
ncbi:unnamed protein product, partial [marine sediment metagenome]